MEFGDEGLGSGLLIGTGCLRHSFLTANSGGFPKTRTSLLIVYKDSTNFRDAHTPLGVQRVSSCSTCGRHDDFPVRSMMEPPLVCDRMEWTSPGAQTERRGDALRARGR